MMRDPRTGLRLGIPKVIKRAGIWQVVIPEVGVGPGSPGVVAGKVIDQSSYASAQYFAAYFSGFFRDRNRNLEDY